MAHQMVAVSTLKGGLRFDSTKRDQRIGQPPQRPLDLSKLERRDRRIRTKSNGHRLHVRQLCC
ncbi:MAG: hypothetical protein A2213_08970 [Lysobacterales bacterium RIFOXYA1_FULL_68_6]|nr:MAG: hypothetical protein A2213_08970 [Xanthomonadales bacterium RIFOXYA1_FULL_68_6]